MNYFWLDASALVKRYMREIRTPLVNHLFTRVSASSMVCLLESVGEGTSVFVRGRNSRMISATIFHQILLQLEIEVSQRRDFEKIHPVDSQVVASWKFIEKHSINSTDAIILRCALDKVSELKANGHDLVLVSADMRLVRAAKAEGLQTFNPETESQPALDALIN